MPIETDSNTIDQVCANPFHEAQCSCRSSVLIRPGRDSVYESFSRPRSVVLGQARFEAGGNQIHEAGGNQRFEARGSPRHEMSATPVFELDGESAGDIGTAR